MMRADRKSAVGSAGKTPRLEPWALSPEPQSLQLVSYINPPFPYSYCLLPPRHPVGDGLAIDPGSIPQPVRGLQGRPGLEPIRPSMTERLEVVIGCG